MDRFYKIIHRMCDDLFKIQRIFFAKVMMVRRIGNKLMTASFYSLQGKFLFSFLIILRDEGEL